MAFDFVLAERLGMTVERLYREMSYEERVRWSVYFGRQRQERELAAKARHG